MKKRASGTWQIEIRDQRLRGGRLSLSSRTSSKPTARRREAAIRVLLDQGELELVERLRDRSDPVHIADIQRAVEERDPDEKTRLMDGLRHRPGADGDVGPLTLDAILDRGLQTIEATLSYGSVKGYRTVAKMLRKRFDGGMDARRFSSDDAETFLHEPKARRKKGEPDAPWSAGRQEIVRTLAGRFWNDAIRREAERAEIEGRAPRLTRNPWRASEIKGEVTPRAAFLQPEEWRVVSKKAEGTFAHALLALGCLAGLRLMEAAHLRPGIDLDLERRIIRIQPRGGEYAWKPKTPRSVRDVPIGDELLRILQAHVEAGYAGERYFLRLPGEDRPISHQTLQSRTRDAFEAAGIRYGREGDALTNHSLRHTFASWLVQRDVQMMKVARLLGDTVEMVEKVYGHLLPGDLERAVKIIDQVAGAARG